MADYRRFTKEDWYGWGGATQFKNGQEPFIYEQKLNNGDVDMTVIVDAAGVSISMLCEYDDEPEAMTWSYEQELTSIKAEGIMRALVKKLKEYDYAPDLSYELDHQSCDEFKKFEYMGEF